jgi:hypothetical protein
MADDAVVAAGMSVGVADQRRPRGRIFGDVDGAPADDRAAAGAGTQFRQGHSNRHSIIPSLAGFAGIGTDVSAPCGAVSESRCKPVPRTQAPRPPKPRNRRVSAAFVPKLHSLPGRVKTTRRAPRADRG